MQQLGALDAVFLSMETPSTPAHIGGVTVLDPSTSGGRFDFDSFRAFVKERLELCPRFSWKLQEVPLRLDLPYWVEDDDFCIDNHIRRVALPAPGGEAELAELAGFLFEKPLDRDRPLWEMFMIEGLQGGRVGMLWKIHHCLMDGVSGAGLVELLFDLEPEPAARPLVDPGDVAQAGGKASPLQLALRGLRNASQRPRALRRHLRRTAASAYAAVRSHGIAGIANAPRVSFNGDVGPRRAVRWTSVSLAEVKALKNRHDVTLNDVVLALTGSALRRYLLQRGELPATPLSVMIPISTRTDGDDSLGNQVSQASLPWATNLADPVERLLSLHEDAERAKKTASATGSNLMAALGESLPPYLTQLLIRASAVAPERTPLPANAVVSNVRCTEVPLYIAGARIDRLLPVSVLAPGQGLNITVLSYCGELHFGITADPDLVPELALIADGIPKALTELWEATANPAARAEGDDELSGSEVRPAA